MSYNPKFDGVDHLNVYSKGGTWLGRELSNFAKYKIVTPEGEFNSIEGYWYYLGTLDDYLKTLHGYDAKKYGQSLPKINTLSDDEFKYKIKNAITYKITHNMTLLDGLQTCKLPLTHYYYYGSIDSPKVVDAGFRWIIDHLETFKDS